MQCQVCKKATAKVHYTQIVDNQVKKVDMCEACAKEKGVNDPASFSLADLLLGLGASQKMEEASTAAGGDQSCPQCGFTQADFKKSGRLGCSHCYEVFADGLEALLKGMHKGTQHKGKVPAALRRATDVRAKLTKLEADLKAAITREDFELAATLRDEIKQAKKAEAEV
ncbi:MAG TPA: UvrB/UvrC motif-containing protein [Candidatus Limnocylindria bacterium]|nr:UvrB/UvrC motif-containing protein [Candidatus Limnocylindria bacterium]